METMMVFKLIHFFLNHSSIVVLLSILQAVLVNMLTCGFHLHFYWTVALSM